LQIYEHTYKDSLTEKLILGISRSYLDNRLLLLYIKNTHIEKKISNYIYLLLLLLLLTELVLLVSLAEFLREGGVWSVAGSVITGLYGKPYCSLRVFCCCAKVSDEKEGPICPNHTQRRMTAARDSPMTSIVNATTVRLPYP
jgi:hypothetical protein